MTENKRFTHKKWYNERQLFDGDEPFAIVDVYIQAEAICDKLNELNDFKDNVFNVIDKKIEWHLLQAKKCRNQGNIKKAIKFEESIMTLNILRRDIE